MRVVPTGQIINSLLHFLECKFAGKYTNIWEIVSLISNPGFRHMDTLRKLSFTFTTFTHTFNHIHVPMEREPYKANSWLNMGVVSYLPQEQKNRCFCSPNHLDDVVLNYLKRRNIDIYHKIESCVWGSICQAKGEARYQSVMTTYYTQLFHIIKATDK